LALLHSCQSKNSDTNSTSFINPKAKKTDFVDDGSRQHRIVAQQLMPVALTNASYKHTAHKLQKRADHQPSGRMRQLAADIDRGPHINEQE